MVRILLGCLLRGQTPDSGVSLKGEDMITEAQFNRGTLDCMTALRRRLKQDMGVTIRLAEPDAVERMLQLSNTSEMSEIRELGLRLSTLLMPSLAPDEEAMLAQGAIAARQYHQRATRVVELATEPPTASASVRIYRGQIIRS